MACNPQVFSGLPANCDANRGGVQVVYIANRSDVTGIELGTPEKDTITTITMKTKGETEETAKFKAYHFKKGAASFTSTFTLDNANGVNFVTTVLSIDFAKMETAKRVEMQALSLGEMAVIVLDANGTYWYLGYDEPVYASAGTGETGAARTDVNKYSIELTDESESLPYEVDKSALATIIAE